MLGSEETFHQKLIVPGPVTVVWNEVVWLSPMRPLRAASVASRLTAVWPTHGGVPFVVQRNVGASSASASGTNWFTMSAALELTAPPAGLLMSTE